MKKSLPYLLVTFLVFVLVSVSCKSGTQASSANTAEKELTISEAEALAFQKVEGDTIAISSDKTEYEIIIIEPGFQTWLNSIARPVGHYSQSFLENRNRIWVVNWNQRVLQPQVYNTLLYEMQIDYQPHIDYGYEVNYKLYNYFVYFQRKYRQRLGTFTPRI